MDCVESFVGKTRYKYKDIQATSLLDFTKKWFIQRGATQEQLDYMPADLSTEIKMEINKKHALKFDEGNVYPPYYYCHYHINNLKNQPFKTLTLNEEDFDDESDDTIQISLKNHTRKYRYRTYYEYMRQIDIADNFDMLCDYSGLRYWSCRSFIGRFYGNWYTISVDYDMKLCEKNVCVGFPDQKLIKKYSKNPHIDPFPEMYWQPKHNLFLPKFIMKNPYI